MSLTGLLRKDNGSHHAKELRAIITTLTPSKEKFKTLNNTPPFSNNAIFSAPYSFTDFRYASISGTAFDYLARILGEFKHEVRQFQKPYDNQQAEQISLMV